MHFVTQILRYDQHAEKTGWTYILIPTDVTDEIFPGNKKMFYVKGRLDKLKIKGVCLMPVGGGVFMMPLNAAMRKAVGKGKGAMLDVDITKDKPPVVTCPELDECLDDDPDAKEFFYNGITGSHRNYFIKWINSAKTEETKIKRISQTVIAMGRKMGYGEMIHYFRDNPGV